MSSSESGKMSEQNILSEQRLGDLRVVAVQAVELIPDVADALLLKQQESLAAGESIKLVLDLSEVKFIDSVALGTLVVLLRRIKEGKGRLAMAGLGGHSLRVMQVTGLEKVFELYEDVASAAEALRNPA